MAQWLQTRSEVAKVFCPALPDHPSHTLWQRDCTGTNGLISFEFKPAFDQADAERLIDSLELFGIGASWGGYESLVTLADVRHARSVADWSNRGQVIRLHIGLEDPADLIADLVQAFKQAARADVNANAAKRKKE